VADFDDVRRISMSLPEAEEILTWETDVPGPQQDLRDRR
jgi:hypothetical protein